MPRTGGEITRERILKVAEELFSRKGFDGTGLEEIAARARINKATIYYHFKNKKEIMKALINGVIVELNAHIEASGVGEEARNSRAAVIKKIREEIQFVEKRKDILSIMLMESLKSGYGADFLFQCAELTINNELKLHDKIMKAKKARLRGDMQKFFLHEFFTGFIPLVSFVIFRDSWCEYFKCDGGKLLDNFLESFEKSHLNTHS